MHKALKDALEKAGIDMPFNTMNLVFDKDVHKNVISTHPMSSEEMKQFEMERIQEEEEQAKSDAGDPNVQVKQANGAEQTEHLDLETLEEEHKAAEQAKAVSSDKGYQFDSLYEISQSQSTDVKTVRNQVEELKTLLEIQRASASGAPGATPPVR